MTALSKNVYIHKLSELVKEKNNLIHKTIKMKTADINKQTYIDFPEELSTKPPKYKVSDHVELQSMKL